MEILSSSELLTHRDFNRWSNLWTAVKKMFGWSLELSPDSRHWSSLLQMFAFIHVTLNKFSLTNMTDDISLQTLDLTWNNSSVHDWLLNVGLQCCFFPNNHPSSSFILYTFRWFSQRVNNFAHLTRHHFRHSDQAAHLWEYRSNAFLFCNLISKVQSSGCLFRLNKVHLFLWGHRCTFTRYSWIAVCLHS